MKKRYKLIYSILRPLIYFLFKFIYRPIAFNKEYIPKTGPVIIIGNHRHALDPLLIGMSTKRIVNFLAKKELHQGFKKIFFQFMGTVPVDLNNKNPEAMKQLEEILNKQEAVGMFPEAKRNYTKEILLPFKYGTVTLAKNTNALIVPSGIKGEYKLFEKGLTITFGQPFSIENMTLDEANEYLMNRVKEILKND